MSRDHWEDSLEKMCDSPEEVSELKETASLFAQLPDTHSSLSFQEELKQKLLLQATKQGEERQRIIGSILGRVRNLPRYHSRSLGFAAAALLIVFTGSVLYNQTVGFGKPEAGGPEHQERPLLSDAGDYIPESSDTPVNIHEKPRAVAEEPGGETEVSPEQDSPAAVEEDKPSPGSSQQDKPTTTGNELKDLEQDDVIPLPDDPDFEVYKNRQSFTLAGNIILNYGSGKIEDKLYTVDNVRYNWEPNKIVLAAENGYSFGTTEWAKQLLEDEGFRVKNGDTLKVKIQETVQGLFAEIFYQISPALILHVHQDKGILAYYYEEKGAVAPHGFYPLLAPAKALEQQMQLKSSIEDQQLHFSFRTVSFTYHDFLVEKDGISETKRLPAYCFIGGEMYQGKEGVSFYVPAVK